MEDAKFELEIPVKKSEEDTITDNKEVNLHSVIDAENRSDSESDSPEFVGDIKESTVSEVQKYSSLDSTTEKILPDDSLHDLYAFTKYLSLEHEDNNTRKFDEQEDINSRNIRVKNFVDVHQTKLCKNLKHDSSMSSSRRNEFNNTTRESSELHSTTENILPDDSLHDLYAFMKYLSLEHEDSNTGNFDEQEDINSRNIRVKNFVDVQQTKLCKNLKYDPLKEVKEESSCENSKKESAPTKSEKVQPLKQTFSKTKRRALKTEKRNKVSSKYHRSASIDVAKKELEAVLPDTQIASPEKRVDQTYKKSIHLSAEAVVKRRSQIFQAHISTSPSKGTKKISHGQFDMVRGDRSKNQAVPVKIMTGKAEKTGCLNQSRCEAEVSSCNSLVNTGNLATIHEEPMAASDIMFQINNRNIAFDTDEMRIAVDLLLSEHVEERMIEKFTIMVMKLPFDGLRIEEKCLEFLGHLCDILDKNIGVNSQKLLKREIEYFKATKKKLEDVSIELDKFMKQMDVISSENFAVKPDFKTKETKKKLEDVCTETKKAIKQTDVMSSEKFAMKPDLKTRLRDNIEFMYTKNSTLYPQFKKVLQKLREMDNRIVIKGSKENRLKKVIVEFVEVIESMHGQTFYIQETLKFCFEKMVPLLEKM